MSNAYCNRSQLIDLYDQRMVNDLSGDQNARQGEPSRVDRLLDLQASELESYLTGRVALPLSVSPIPGVLTKWVAATTMARLFARRNDKPKEVEADEKWAADWLDLFLRSGVLIPGVSPASVPVLQDSDFTDGRSRFDYVYGQRPSKTGPSKGL